MIPQFVPYWGESEKQAVLDVLDSDYLNEHKTVREFEKAFAELVGADYCVTFTSGTVALYCAIQAQDYRDSWIVPDHDGLFAFNATIACNSAPVPIDVNKHGVLETDETGSIVVHANGRIAPHVPNIEDCSQATGYHTRGRISTYSFASTKHITTAGQGGAVCCDDQKVFDALTRLKDHGRNDRQNLKPMSDRFDSWGMNFKFTEIQAAFGLAQLRGFGQRVKRFEEIYAAYRDILKSRIVFDEEAPLWYVDIFVDNPDYVIGILKKNGFGARRLPRPLHEQELCNACGVKTAPNDYPNTVMRYGGGLYLPSSTNLSDEEVKIIAKCVRDAV